MDEHVISQNPTRIFAVISSGDPIGHIQQSVTGAANLNNIPVGANRAIVQPDNGDVRYRDDGVAPTSAIGMYLSSQNTLDIQTKNGINQIQLIAVSGTVNVNISYYQK